jgi:hypothetical protein
MTTTTVETASETQFLEELVSHGHFLQSGELGIYGRGMAFEDVRTSFDALVTRVCAPALQRVLHQKDPKTFLRRD